MKKLIYSVLALGAAAALSFSTGADVSAATTDTEAVKYGGSDVKVISNDGDNLVLDVTGKTKVLVGVAKAKGTAITVSSWDTYDVANLKKTETEGTGDDQTSKDTLSIDLSKYAKTKQNIICVKADFELDKDANTIVIPASPKIKVKYSKDKSAVEFEGDKTASELRYYTESNTASDATAKLDREKENDEKGTVEIPEKDYAKYQMSGAAVYFETVQGKSISDYYTAEDAAFPENTITGFTGTAKGWVLSARPSKAVKLSVAKKANAPKLKVNYTANTITVAKKLSFSILTQGENDAIVSVPDTEAGVVDVPESSSKGAVLEVDRNATATTATTEGGKIKADKAFAVDVYTTAITTGSNPKPASKVGHYVFKAQPEITAEQLAALSGTFEEKGTNNYTIEVVNTSADAFNLIYNTSADVKKTAKISAKKTADGKGKATKAYNTTVLVQVQGNAKKGNETWASATAALTLTEKEGSGGSQTATSGKVTLPDGITATYTDAESEKTDEPIVSGVTVVPAGAEVTVTLPKAIKNYKTLTVGTTSKADDSSDATTFKFTVNGDVEITAVLKATYKLIVSGNSASTAKFKIGNDEISGDALESIIEGTEVTIIPVSGYVPVTIDGEKVSADDGSKTEYTVTMTKDIDVKIGA